MQEQRSSEASTRNPQTGTGIDTGGQLNTFQPSTGGDFLRTEKQNVALKVVGNSNPTPAVAEAKPFPTSLLALLITVCILSGYLLVRILPRLIRRSSATEDLGEEVVDQVVDVKVEAVQEMEKPKDKKPKSTVVRKKKAKKKKRR